MDHLHLIVADLAASAGPATPALAALLARGRTEAGAQSSLTAALCRAFGLAPDAPIAPLTLALDGLDPGDAYWLRADPVHLRLQIDRFILSDSRLLRLKADEAGALTTHLNRHYAEDGLEFLAPVPERWYLRLPEPPRLATAPLDAVAGQAIDAHLPAGEGARTWRSRLNEVQMLLHEHPVNLAREARGELAVNSVWFWGGGARPAVARPPFGSVHGPCVTARALALAAGVRAGPEPAELAALGDESGSALVVLDGLYLPARHGDAAGCRAQLAAYEAQWFAPLLAALKAGRLRALTLEGTGAEAFRLRVGRWEAWRFWRRA